jgi:drug/metabolite transporter (DMT)-like permease
MVAGILLIVAGILLVLYPPLLSIIVALFLIITGAMVISIARYNRRYQKHFDNPTIERFFKY